MSEDSTHIYKIDGQRFKTQEEYRSYLSGSEKYRNAYEPWTEDLDQELLELSKSLTTKELALHFRRRTGAITSRLRKLDTGNMHYETILPIEIIVALIDGYDPLTGEIFGDDSIWRHPKIKDDLERWLATYKNS